MTDTIFALSSGAPPAAIAVVRVSGPQAHALLERMAGPLPEERTLSLRSLHVWHSGELLDRALVAWFAAERSVTGEPLVELHLHGGRATVDAVEAVLASVPGVRRARAGEFTWRAFENGRLDLVQVESLSDLLRAETEAQRRAALAEGGLSGKVEQWRQQLLQLSALAEAALDQSDEDDVPADRARIDAVAADLIAGIGQLLARPGAERLFDGARVVFAGPPNAGKSTLINALAGREVAITSAIAGTTRDVIEAPVRIGGVAFVLTDTAGLRQGSGDEIERIGIDRAQRRIDEADLVVWMDERAEPDVADEKLIRIFPRADEPGRSDAAPGMRVSAVTGEGLADLADMLVERARTLLPREGEVALTRRQREHLAHCHAALVAFAAEPDELIAAEQLRLARQAIDELTGRAGAEEMLDALFGTFCIGK
ncbi:tRNA modification GTPase MnmE [Sphingomonas changbaiensis NBRC 104936]|uniref:tRNA modification GTPase MnmE n=1 Tax=Sphingomonas changbaiensis NBRC 104936 TaxID=1219043 RepID=A0A0E9MQP4_9SPHN|nr:tRNA uridine-5-carboxymethylaminomethyl(34) synthesis GTPase MnmE [Sphingomonas changbaiensis]GAO40092.1 tRNA modification GTPase MnmE [Sphingomonas changbaiensis NBRC 104936]